MAYLFLSQSFLVLVSKLVVSLQPASPLSPSFSPPHQHLVSLQPTIILALKGGSAGTTQKGGTVGALERLRLAHMKKLNGIITNYKTFLVLLDT